MPVKKFIPRDPPAEAQDLRDRLVAEWRATNSSNTQPIIIEDSGRANQPMRVYVVWNEWEALSGIERSEIIMDAFEKRYGPDRAVNVTVAMGLTTAEADRMGIRY